MLVTFLLVIVFPAMTETRPDERPQVVVSVYNDAGVAETVMEQAEQEAARIFGRAGLDVAWKNCSPSPNHVRPDALVRAGERSSPGFEQESSPSLNPAGLRPAGWVGAPAPTRSSLEALECAKVDWPVHLALRVVPRSRLSTSEVFGVAFLSSDGEGCYSDVFYDRMIELHANWNASLPDTLGNVMAHELGHLLLGSNSHSGVGIMRARWQGEDLRRMSRGGLWFTIEEAYRMSSRLNRARPTIELAARSSY
jgi:hypothetical protein